MNRQTEQDQPATDAAAVEPAMNNRLRRELARLAILPAFLRPWMVNFAIHHAIPFTGTAGIRLESLDDTACAATLRNRRKVRNHIGGIHATASALLVETTTGLAFGWYLPDDRLPLLKRLDIRYVSVATGNLRAVAQLEESTRKRMQQDLRGDAVIAVTVTDETGAQPLDCRIEWAWVPKRQDRKSSA